MSSTPARPNVGGFFLLMLCLAGWTCAFLLFTRNPVVLSVAGTIAPKSALTLSDNRFVTTDGQYVTLWQVAADNKLMRLDTQMQVEWSRRMEDAKKMFPGATGNPTPPATSPVSSGAEGGEFIKQDGSPESAGTGQAPPQGADSQTPPP